MSTTGSKVYGGIEICGTCGKGYRVLLRNGRIRNHRREARANGAWDGVTMESCPGSGSLPDDLVASNNARAAGLKYEAGDKVIRCNIHNKTVNLGPDIEKNLTGPLVCDPHHRGEYGVFDEIEDGIVHAEDCAAGAADYAADLIREDDDYSYKIVPVCAEHPGHDANTCAECNDETPDDDTTEDDEDEDDQEQRDEAPAETAPAADPAAEVIAYLNEVPNLYNLYPPNNNDAALFIPDLRFLAAGIATEGAVQRVTRYIAAHVNADPKHPIAEARNYDPAVLLGPNRNGHRITVAAVEALIESVTITPRETDEGPAARILAFLELNAGVPDFGRVPGAARMRAEDLRALARHATDQPSAAYLRMNDDEAITRIMTHLADHRATHASGRLHSVDVLTRTPGHEPVVRVEDVRALLAAFFGSDLAPFIPPAAAAAQVTAYLDANPGTNAVSVADRCESMRLTDADLRSLAAGRTDTATIARVDRFVEAHQNAADPRWGQHNARTIEPNVLLDANGHRITVFALDVLMNAADRPHCPEYIEAHAGQLWTDVTGEEVINSGDSDRRTYPGITVHGIEIGPASMYAQITAVAEYVVLAGISIPPGHSI